MYLDFVLEFTFIAPARYTEARKHTVSSLESTKPLVRSVASSQWTKSCQPRSMAFPSEDSTGEKVCLSCFTMDFFRSWKLIKETKN
eukprot:Skav236436  [mRNA]  locus=scaffold2857:58677:61024:- [translate_table: standard]